MIKIFILTFFLCHCINSAFSQKTGDNNKIIEVENGLLERTEVVFADSIIAHHNIYERMEFYKVPSISIAVIENGKIAWAKAYGLADQGKERRADPYTLYQAASITKSINAFAILKLVQDDKLSLDWDIRKYLKTWDFPDNEFSTGEKITLRHLLSHTAGLSTTGFMGYSMDSKVPTINQMMDGVSPANSEAVKPILPPGKSYKYSGGGTLITRKILEDNFNQDYVSLLHHFVFKPLGMKNSSFSDPLRSKQRNFAVAYNKEMEEVTGKYYLYPEQAPDGLWTTATDLAKFIISLQESLNGKPGILDKVTASEMLTPVLESSEAALGVFVTQRGDEKYFRHTGANIGFQSEFWGSISTGDGIVVLTNSDNGQPLIEEIVRSVAASYNWKGFYQPKVIKLVEVPDSVLEQYAGSYVSENPAIQIKIEKKDHGLELSAKNSEMMYAIGNNTFIILSSPSQKIVFSNSGGSTIDTFKVIEGERVFIEAKKD